MTTQTMRRLALFYDLPLQFAAVTSLDALLQTIVERLVDVIPGAARGALLLKDRTDRAIAPESPSAGGQPGGQPDPGAESDGTAGGVYLAARRSRRERQQPRTPHRICHVRPAAVAG